jgi:CRP-like cAMP-binding protein
MSRRLDWPSSLAGLEVFADATRQELRAASGLLTPVTVGADEVLVRQGRVGKEFLIVVDGLVNVTQDRGADEKILGVVTSGDVLGEISLLHRLPRSATATTLVPTTVVVGTPREFFALLEAVPSAARRIKQAAALRLQANMAA